MPVFFLAVFFRYDMLPVSYNVIMNPDGDLIEQYLDNIEKMHALNNLTFPADTSGEDVYRGLQDAHHQAEEIRKENQVILHDPSLGIYTLVEKMTPSQAENLKKFAAQLSKFASHKDLGLFYQIHVHLLAYAQYIHDQVLEIEENYYCGIAIYYLNTPFEALRMDTHEDLIRKYFQANADLLPKITEIADHDAQFFIIRSIGNTKLGYSLFNGPEPFSLFPPRKGDVRRYIDEQHAVIKLFFDPQLEKELPYLPWETLRFTITVACMTMLSYLRNTEDAQEADYIYERAKYIEAHRDQTDNAKNRFVKPRYVYYLAASSFHAGKITIDQMLSTLFTTIESADSNDRTLDGAYLNLDLSSFVIEYWGKYSRDEKWRPHLEKIKEKAQEYLKTMPDYDSSHVVVSYLIHQMNLNYTYHLQSDAGYLLKNLMILERATYVHSYIVSELSRTIASWMFQHHPEVFAGLQAYMKEKGMENTAPFVMEMVRMAGLYSDVGILSILYTARMENRPYTEEENEIFEVHPYAGYITLCLHPDTEIYALTALGHSRWYNGEGGFPSYYDRKKNPTAIATDIVYTAAYLESSTNTLRMRFDEPIDSELALTIVKENAGTQFHPLMKEAVEDPSLRERLIQILEKGRKAAYIRIYRRVETAEK